MKYDCRKAIKICLWFNNCRESEERRWRITSMEPSWYCYVPVSHELFDGDEITISKDCKIDVNRRVIIDEDVFRLVQYNEKKDILVKVNREPFNRIQHESEKQRIKR